MRCPCLERHTANRFISWDLPPDEDGQDVRSLCADRSHGVVWYRAQGQWQWKQEASYRGQQRFQGWHQMKRTLLVLAATLVGLPAQAEIIHKIQSSVQLTVDGAGSVADRVGSSLSVSGNNVTLDTTPALGTLTSGTALGYTPGAFSITTAGDSFSYSETYIEGDDVPSVLSTTVTSGVVPSLPAFGSTTTTSGGVAGSLAGTIATDGALTITAGGAGTTAIGQVIQELTIK